MNVKKLMNKMQQRDFYKQREQDLKQELKENAKSIQQQLIKEAKNNAILNTIQSAFVETESNVKSGNRQQEEAVSLSTKKIAEENVLLKKALAQQSQKLRAYDVKLAQKIQ